MRKYSLSKSLVNFSETFGVSRAVSISVFSLIAAALAVALYLFFHSAPPTHLTISSGPKGSLLERHAKAYAERLATNGVKLILLPSNGSLENLERLQNHRVRVDLGFVQCGVTNKADSSGLMSLGSLFYEPMFIFYRGDKPVTLLSEFQGKRLAIGPEGSGTRTLALALLATNNVSSNASTIFLDLEAEPAAKALLAGNVDALFLMADSAALQVMRQLLHSPDVHLYDFKQADAYTRRFQYLNKLEMPMGAFDFAKNIPAQNIQLVGPTVELVARRDLHPALSDLLLDAATDEHKGASILQKKDEFPANIERGFPISPDAARYYKSGKRWLYSVMPFWLASMLNRIAVIFLPTIVVTIPILRIIPTVYRWRMRLRIQRWYRALLALEQSLANDPTGANRSEVLKRLDAIEMAVHKLKLPASFGDQFYGLRGHIIFVRDRLAQDARLK